MVSVIEPTHDCPHVLSSLLTAVDHDGDDGESPLTALKAEGMLGQPCRDCDPPSHRENWVCLSCLEVGCGRYVEGHLAAHCVNEEHDLALSLVDLTIWCYKCESYVVTGKTQAFRAVFHVAKFGEAPPRTPEDDIPEVEPGADEDGSGGGGIAAALVNARARLKRSAPIRGDDRESLADYIVPDGPLVWDAPRDLATGDLILPPPADAMTMVACAADGCDSSVPLGQTCDLCGLRARPVFNGPIRVVVMRDEGFSKVSYDMMVRALEAEPDMEVTVADAKAVLDGALDDADVIAVPGGSHRGVLAKLKARGRKAVRDFIVRGGGFFGVCGGLFFAWNLGVAAVDVTGTLIENAHFYGIHGKGETEAVEPAWGEVCGEDTSSEPPSDGLIAFSNGPLVSFARIKRAGLGDVVPFAIYTNDLCAEVDAAIESMISGNAHADNSAWNCFACTLLNEDPAATACRLCGTARADHSAEAAEFGERPPVGIMPGSFAGFTTTYGHGRLVCWSPHPELTTGREHLCGRSVRWAAPAWRREELPVPTASSPVSAVAEASSPSHPFPVIPEELGGTPTSDTPTWGGSHAFPSAVAACPHHDGDAGVAAVGDLTLGDVQDAVCGECGATDDRHVCLDCGAVLCGRDGGGSGHMAAHGAAEGHALALRMADGVCWCYECEAFVTSDFVGRCQDLIRLALLQDDDG